MLACHARTRCWKLGERCSTRRAYPRAFHGGVPRLRSLYNMSCYHYRAVLCICIIWWAGGLACPFILARQIGVALSTSDRTLASLLLPIGGAHLNGVFASMVR